MAASWGSLGCSQPLAPTWCELLCNFEEISASGFMCQQQQQNQNQIA